MDRLNGVLVVLAGTVLGTYFGLPPAENGSGGRGQAIPYISAPDMIRTGAGITTIAKKAPSSLSADQDSHRIRVFSPSEPLLAAIQERTAATAVAQPSPTWSTVITRGSASASKLSSPRPSDPATRSALAADLQRELQRVGCYSGEINGGWTTSTRHAMGAFMERVNALLPTEEPDIILLTLVQNHRGQACGVACPAGEVEASGGRCLPEAVLAHATQPPKADTAPSEEEIRHAELQKLRASRHAVASRTRGDRRQVAAAATPETEVLPWSEQLPWHQQQPTTTASIVKSTATDAYPGRMAVGGPVPSDARNARASLTSETENPSAEDRAAPAPQPAIRPATRNDWQSRQAALQQHDLQQQGLPGGKSGVAARPGLTGSKSGPAAQRPKKTVSKPRSPAAQRVLRNKKRHYASGPGSKSRRYQRRLGTANYYVMMSLGGIR